jgi:hypothetical protein
MKKDERMIAWDETHMHECRVPDCMMCLRMSRDLLHDVSRDLLHDVFANVAGLTTTGSSVKERFLNNYECIVYICLNISQMRCCKNEKDERMIT